MTTLSVSHTSRAATGQWPVLLPALGINITAGGRAQPCPMCGGKDRFRFDNLQGRGTWFCNQCGGGDGLNLVEKALAVTPKEAACKVAEVLGEP
ncbi:primase-helicase zinc-binding domain-containing protein, partial [Yersinia massiliensis]